MKRLKIWVPMGVVGGIAVAALLLVKAPESSVISAGPQRQEQVAETQPDSHARAAAGSIPNGTDHLQVRFENDLLTVSANRVPLKALIREISRRAYIAIELDEGVARDHVSADFTGLPLEEGLSRILGGYDVFSYHRGGKGLLTLWVYPKLEGRGLMPIPADIWASTADLQKRLEDNDPAERASALESLVERGGSVSEQEIIRALGDGDEKVRTVALYGALNEGIELPPKKLANLAFNDSSYSVRYLALRNLAGRPGELKALEAAVDDPNPVIRSYAESAMLRLYPSDDPPGPEELQNSNP